MSLNFVTGKRGGAHISSADWRSLNRGIIGEGKFYLEDTSVNNNGTFLVNPIDGEISVPARSFLWSGAHIRNDAIYAVNYVPPLSTSTVNLWFHYTKDMNSGIENIELVTTIDSQPSPIVDVIEDATLEAYTLVYSFVHNAENVSAENSTEYFESINSVKMLSNATNILAESIIAESNEREQAIALEKAEREKQENRINTSISEVENALSKVRGLEVLNYNAQIPTSSGTSIPLENADVDKFSFLVIGFGNHSKGTTNGYHIVVPATIGEFRYNQLIIESVSLSSANKVVTLIHKFDVSKNSSNKLTLKHSLPSYNSDYANDYWRISYVYGIY